MNKNYSPITYADVLQKFVPFDENTDFSKFFGYFGSHSYDDMPSRAEILHDFWDYIPSSQKYDLFVTTYILMHSTCTERWLTNLIREIRNYKPQDVKDFLYSHADDKGVLTVYRGSDNEVNPKLSYSWSLSKDVAAKFARNVARCGREAYLYTACIKAEDASAYTDDREEQEIIQVQKVFNISKERVYC